MSIQSEIARIANAKADIAAAIMAKGVEVPAGTMLDGMAALIMLLPEFVAEFRAVVDSTLQSGVVLTKVAQGSGTANTVGTSVTGTAPSGGNFGYNVSRFNTDIRKYGTATITITVSGSTGGAGYHPCFVFVGTADQIAGVKITTYNSVTYNGCTEVGGWWVTNKTETFTVDLSAYHGSTEAIYIGCIAGAYNTNSKTITFNEVIYV